MRIKTECPNCGKMVWLVFTSHKRKGSFNSCKFCNPEEYKHLKSLQELNKERWSKETKRLAPMNMNIGDCDEQFVGYEIRTENKVVGKRRIRIND